MKYTICAIILTLVAILPVQADSLYLGGWSEHLAGGSYNTRHDILAYRSDSGYMVGHFFNSYHESTWVVGKSFALGQMAHLELDVGIGATYGYSECVTLKGEPYDRGKSRACPVVIPELSYTKFDYVQPTLMLFGTALVLTFEVKL